MRWEIVGTHPKNPLGFFVIFGSNLASRQLWLSSEGAGAARRLSGWCGYDWRDSLYFGKATAEAKAAYLVHLWYVVSAGPSKTSLASAARPEAASIARKGYILSEL